jgi:hypothetical protein
MGWGKWVVNMKSEGSYSGGDEGSSQVDELAERKEKAKRRCKYRASVTYHLAILECPMSVPFRTQSVLSI